jgi:hypothetical protein
VAAFILVVQGPVLWSYESLTSRQHELPRWLGELLCYVPRALGIDAAYDTGTLALRSLQETLRVAATWELLFDPASVCFLAGGVVLIVYRTASCATGWRRWKAVLWRVVTLAAVMLAWAPFRAAVLMALLLQRILVADPVAAPNVGSLFVNVWLQLLLLTGCTILASRLIDWPQTDRAARPRDTRAAAHQRPWLAAAGLLLLSLGVAGVATLVSWVPVGQPGKGRVVIVERHSTWEPTTEPYGTQVYGEAGSYNYAAVFDYCDQYFQMSRLLANEIINDESLSGCDVLVIKTPTERYAAEEIEAVVRFVARGGSLLLVGDHTNVFNMNTALNDISRRFGFTFRNDLLFRVGDPYRQPFSPGSPAHPIVQHLPDMVFAVSCSIDPGFHRGRMPIRSTGLWSLPPAYHESNYHPQAEYRPRLQYGAWCQLWSTNYGQGRVLGFADSTLFSNFCTFQPGKAELLRGMLDWLNHHSRFDLATSRPILAAFVLLGVILPLALGVVLSARVAGITRFAACLIGWVAATLAIAEIHRRSLPVPPIRSPLKHVVIDRTVSEVPLFTGAFTDGEEGVGYGMLEQWIPRVGNYLSRQGGAEAFTGDALVILCPTRSVDDDYRERLLQFVESGGHVLVFDSVEVENSTANSLLWPFGLESHRDMSAGTERPLVCGFPTPAMSLIAACEIRGGEPIAWLGDLPVAARANYGQGTVTAVGFAGLFNDAGMGFHWLPEPAPEVRDRYEVLYGLLRLGLGLAEAAEEVDPGPSLSRP